ncbi:hypothetical protein EON63_12250 [archaeon]|nr:MAG: hypothetical protein EON63_12250 [archaeon]
MYSIHYTPYTIYHTPYTISTGKAIGHGASGKVYTVTHKVTGQQFACKVVKKNSNMNDMQSMSTGKWRV